jgi:hypothetical protein
MRNRLAVPAALPGLCLLWLAASGCFGGGSPSADLGQADSARAVDQTTPGPTATPGPIVQQQTGEPIAWIPGLAMDGPPPTATLSAEAVYQGGALLVGATGGSTGAVTVFGRTVPMQPVGEELVALFGFGTQDPPGPTYLSIDILNSQGEWEYIARTITVYSTEWTVDYITIPPPPPPDPNAPPGPPPPPPPPDENPLLPGVYAGITERKWDGAWGAPLDELRVTGHFGEQRSFNGGPVQGHHGGTDFGADFGTPIYASNAGVVVMSGLYLVRGNLVVVDHGLGVFTLYGHMSERAVEVGDVVAKGQVLGYIGSTGLSTGAHLHWEVSVFGVLVDGLRWLDGSQGF